jgi:hypothetical protein
VPGDFDQTRGSRIGPWLVWDPDRPAVPGVPDAPPTGFIGIPGILHPVLGSPFGTNFLALERLDGTTWVSVASTDRFDVMGTGRAKPGTSSVTSPLAATPPGGRFVEPPVVRVSVPAVGARVLRHHRRH